MTLNSISENIKRNRAGSLIFLLSLIIRLVHIIEISWTKPYYKELLVDAMSYDNWGREIASGNIIGHGVFNQDPLYPYFLGLIYSVFGHNLFIVLLIQGIIGSITSLLVFLIGKRLANVRVGVIAGILWSLYPPIIFHEGLIMKEGVAVILAVLAVLTLLIARDSAYPRHWLFAGFAFGLSALTRGNIILVIPFILLWIILEYRASSIKFSLFLLIGIFAVFLPVVLRNKLVGGELVLTTSQAGANFYWGNNEESIGSYVPPPCFLRMNPLYEQKDFANEAMRITGKKEMTRSEVSRFWFRKGLNFIIENPGRYAWLEYQKLLLLFNKAEISDNYSYYYLKSFSTVLNYSPVTYWMIASLGLLGMILSVRLWERLSLVYLFMISYSLSLMIFFVLSRYRLILAPFMAFFAALAVEWGLNTAYRKKYLNLVASIFLLMFFAIVVGKDVPWLTTSNKFAVLYNEASDLAFNGEYDAALAKYLLALKEVPSSFTVHRGIGDIYTKKNRYSDAIKEYNLAIEDNPSDALTYFKLGMAYIQAEMLDDAIRQFETFLKLDSNHFYPYFGLALAFDKKGRYEESLIYWEECLRREPAGQWLEFARKRVDELKKQS